MKRARALQKDHRRRCAAKSSRPAIPIDYSIENLVAWLVSEQVSPGVWACAYCSCRLTLDMLEVDHDVPLESGGAADIHNLQVCCKTDNRTKGELTGVAYKRLLDTLKTLGWPSESYVLTALRQVGIAKRLRFIDRKSSGSRKPLSY